MKLQMLLFLLFMSFSSVAFSGRAAKLIRKLDNIDKQLAQDREQALSKIIDKKLAEYYSRKLDFNAMMCDVVNEALQNQSISKKIIIPLVVAFIKEQPGSDQLCINAQSVNACLVFILNSILQMRDRSPHGSRKQMRYGGTPRSQRRKKSRK